MIIRSSLTNKWGLWTILMGLVVVGTGTYSQFNVCFQMSDQWSSKLIYYNVLIAYHCFEFPSFIRLYFPQSLQYIVKKYICVVGICWVYVSIRLKLYRNRYPISHKCCTYKRRDTIFKSGPFALFGSVIWVFLKLLFIKIIFVGIMDFNFDCYNIYIQFSYCTSPIRMAEVFKIYCTMVIK